VRWSATREYKSWAQMMQRCYNPKHPNYHNYGGRGITVAQRWHTFFQFLADMGKRPAGTTIDRYPNNDGNYEPSNCRWATDIQQHRNRRDNVWITHNGETLTQAEWAQRCGIDNCTLASRLKRGWTVEDAVTIPAQQGRRIIGEGFEIRRESALRMWDRLRREKRVIKTRWGGKVRL